jgi:Rieske Fe-S protein
LEKEKQMEKSTGKISKREGKVSRRDFLKAAAIAGGAAALPALVTACAATPAATSSQTGNSIQLDVSQPQYASLASAGGTLALDADALDPAGILVVRVSATAASAFTRKCTHLGCTLPNFQNGIVTCLCHGSQFNEQGAVVRGPAAAPLRSYPVSISGNILTISR